MTTVLIAGGATGIGAASARSLRERGTDVYIADLNLEPVLAAAGDELPGRLAWGRHDLSDPLAPGDAVRAALDEFGGLDGIVVTAGLHVVAPIGEYSLDAWDNTMAINVRAPFLLIQAAVAALQASGGSVVLTGSTAAFRGSRSTFAYAASKGALVSLTRSLAVELAPRVRVNCVCPGWIDTPFNEPYWAAQGSAGEALAAIESRIPAGRQGSPQDVANVILTLLGPESAYLTGQSIIVDGGLLSA